MSKEGSMPKFLLVALTAALIIIALIAQQTMGNNEKDDVESIATEAYIYGYPLVTVELTRRVMTNVEVPEGTKAPMGQFVNARTYPDAAFRAVTAPNADTLYSLAWLNVGKEPYVMHLPEENGRYYLMPMLSGWTEVFEVPGTRTTGTAAGDYAITGPGWTGQLPAGVKELKSPTNLVWILGRTYCTGTPEDYKLVHAIQDQYSLIPLSSYGKPYTPPKGVVDPSVDMNTAVRDQVNRMDAATFFNILTLSMRDNPPAAADAPIVAKMMRIGIIPGKEFDITKLDPDAAKAMERAPKLGLEKIMAHLNNGTTKVNGWVFSTKTGIYGTNYIQRALIAAIGLGANRPQDAVYPNTAEDSEGKPLSGSNRYVVHFSKAQIPPVRGFWSLTMYNDQYFFVQNPLDRYTLSPRNKLQYNSDGSLDLYIQHASPEKGKENNWLPAPEGKFILMLRLYWPEEAVINGKWTPPVVKRLD